MKDYFNRVIPMIHYMFKITLGKADSGLEEELSFSPVPCTGWGIYAHYEDVLPTYSRSVNLPLIYNCKSMRLYMVTSIIIGMVLMQNILSQY